MDIKYGPKSAERKESSHSKDRFEANKIDDRYGSPSVEFVTDISFSPARQRTEISLISFHKIGFCQSIRTPVAKERQPCGTSFLDLPLEIRLMIYRYCLTAHLKTIRPPSKIGQYHVGRTTQTMNKTHEEIRATIQKHRANHPSYVAFPQTYTGLRHPRTRVLTLEVSLLQVNKKIHAEAASVLYGDNEFQFLLAVTRIHRGVRSRNFQRLPYYDFRDNLTVASEKYMRMIRRCTVEVRLPTFPRREAKKNYLQYFARLEAFATCLGGEDHSLEKVAIFLNRSFRHDYYFPLPCLRTSQNVLETLAAIHGVENSVTVGGVTPAFETKLSLAMMSKAIAWVPRQEEYGTRKVYCKGKRRWQGYKLRSYHDSRKVWDQSALGPYPPHSEKALPVYECCEVCDAKRPLKFRHFTRRS